MSERASSTRMRVNVIAWDNGVGLGRDLRLVSRHLAAAGIDSRISSYRRGKLVKWFGPHLMRLRGLSMVMGLVPVARMVPSSSGPSTVEMRARTLKSWPSSSSATPSVPLLRHRMYTRLFAPLL